jgi:DNA-binding NarL/FixJ family response regulator
MHSTEAHIREAFNSNISAYVPKECEFSVLASALVAVASGKHYLPPTVSDIRVNAYVGGTSGDATTSYDALTGREPEVLQLIADGLTNAEG